jgi:formylglycine-generating enzyme required for sulfatase activity
MESHPVVYVTWYDAMAYCRWLKRKLEEVNGKIRIWSMKESTKICLKSGMYDVLLPSEAEWEKAARATKDQSTFPWGDIWQEGYCNTSELGVNKTTPVGIFPEGRSPYGVLEMAGNVWEWTRSQGGNDYPYVIDDGRENLDASNEVTRVVRGGSWFANQDQARCTSRVVRVPVSRNDYYGFRVCVVSHQD